jgi:hypothetical protein
MSMQRDFGMVKGRFKIIFKIIKISLCQMLDLVMVCMCLHMCIANLNGFECVM